MKIDPKPEDIVYCTHTDELDSFVAAWVIRRAARKHQIPVLFSTVVDSTPEDIAGRNYIDLGSPQPFVGAPKGTIIFRLDAQPIHKPLPFDQWERTFPYGIKSMLPEDRTNGFVGGPEKALCAHAWDFFFPEEKYPRLIEFVNDVTKEGGAVPLPDTVSIVTNLETYPKNFQTLDLLVEACEDHKRREALIAGGQAVQRYVANV